MPTRELESRERFLKCNQPDEDGKSARSNQKQQLREDKMQQADFPSNREQQPEVDHPPRKDFHKAASNVDVGEK